MPGTTTWYPIEGALLSSNERSEMILLSANGISAGLIHYFDHSRSPETAKLQPICYLAALLFWTIRHFLLLRGTILIGPMVYIKTYIFNHLYPTIFGPINYGPP